MSSSSFLTVWASLKEDLASNAFLKTRPVQSLWANLCASMLSRNPLLAEGEVGTSLFR